MRHRKHTGPLEFDQQRSFSGTTDPRQQAPLCQHRHSVDLDGHRERVPRAIGLPVGKRVYDPREHVALGHEGAKHASPPPPGSRTLHVTDDFT